MFLELSQSVNQIFIKYYKTMINLPLTFYYNSVFFQFLPSVSSSLEKSCFTHPRCFGQCPWDKTAIDAITGYYRVLLASLWKDRRGAQVGATLEACEVQTKVSCLLLSPLGL